MEKSTKGLTAFALALVGSQAFASVPEAPQFADATKAPPITIGTGLTTADLVVGLDGTVAFDLTAHGIKVAACPPGIQENNNCTNVCCS